MLIAFNKPYGVLCQFRDADGRLTLADFIDLPDVYAAGRLDRDSEGLLLLTDDGDLQHQLTDPKHKTAKTYLVQVEGRPQAAQLDRLRKGVELKDGRTRAAEVALLAKKPGWLWTRQPPIRTRKSVPTSWLQITLREGRNRQVRRMTAAVNLPTLRLVRSAIGRYELVNNQQLMLSPGQWKTL